MPAHVLIGAQWGDEGKGRMADWLAARSDVVARYAGGDNAGHTVNADDHTLKLHMVPSGIVHPGVRCVMGGGMVINPVRLAGELQELGERGLDISPGRILLADTAHVVTPAHIALDGADEASRGESAIGTTKRGIGPAYTDKASRSGIRTGTMNNPDAFVEAIKKHIERGNRILADLYKAPPINPEDTAADLHAAAEYLKPYLANAPLFLHESLLENKRVLCEGAQGTLLDLDHGIYPYVTSSSATIGGALTGLGIGPRHIEKIIGVVKAYSTRVGGGPFPTELQDKLGDKLRGTGSNPWDEYGTTTGRPRRCGWLDMMVIRYAARINGLTDLVVTKLDVLSGFEEIKIAEWYVSEGQQLDQSPTNVEMLENCQPVYTSLDGWQEDIMDIRHFADLPAEAQMYIQTMEEMARLPITLISVGPARDQMIEDH